MIPLRWQQFPLQRYVGEPSFAVLQLLILCINLTDLEQLAWFIAFVASIIATAKEKSNDQFPNYAWFGIAYMLCVIIGVFVVIASDTTQTYHVAIVGYLACGLVLTSSSVNATIYSSNGAREAAAAGHILLSMVNVGNLYMHGYL